MYNYNQNYLTAMFNLKEPRVPHGQTATDRFIQWIVWPEEQESSLYSVVIEKKCTVYTCWEALQLQTRIILILPPPIMEAHEERAILEQTGNQHRLSYCIGDDRPHIGAQQSLEEDDRLWTVIAVFSSDMRYRVSA
jgi:hypothetical protein